MRGGEVPQSLGVAVVWLGEARGADLGARWSEKDLGGGGVDGVVEVAGEDEPGLALR